MERIKVAAWVTGMFVVVGGVSYVLVPLDTAPTPEPTASAPTSEPSHEPSQEPPRECDPPCRELEVCVAGVCEPDTPPPSPPHPTEPPPSNPPPPPPPPGVLIGHGRNVTGGAGGRLIQLGPSSTEADVRAALTATGPREIRTVVGMAPPVWFLTEEVIINTRARGDLTIDFSASRGGTIVTKQRVGSTYFEGVRFANGVENVLIRKVRFDGLKNYVPGTQPTPHVNNASVLEFDGDGNYPASCIKGVYLDHVVVRGSVDSGPDFYGCVEDVTVDGGFVYDGLHPMTISEPQVPNMANAQPRRRLTVKDSLFAENGERSMALRNAVIDFDAANNVIWNWAATYYGRTALLAGGYGSRIEDDFPGAPTRVIFRGSAWLAGPLSVNGPIDHRGWGLIYGTKGGCDIGGNPLPADPADCNPRLKPLAIRTTDNIFPPQQTKYDGYTTAAGKTLPDPSYPLAVLSSRDLESVILGAGIPEADTPREAQLRAEALAAYRARLAQ